MKQRKDDIGKVIKVIVEIAQFFPIRTQSGSVNNVVKWMNFCNVPVYLQFHIFMYKTFTVWFHYHRIKVELSPN